MDMYPVRILTSQPIRLALTIGGVALCIVLMLFPLSVYRGAGTNSDRISGYCDLLHSKSETGKRQCGSF
jgi:hypothetical protein